MFHNLTRHGITKGPCHHNVHMEEVIPNLLAPTSWGNGKQLQLHTTLGPCVYLLHGLSPRLGQAHPPLRGGQILRMRNRVVSKRGAVQTRPRRGTKQFQSFQIHKPMQFQIFHFHRMSVQVRKFLRLFQRLQIPATFPNFRFHRMSMQFHIFPPTPISLEEVSIELNSDLEKPVKNQASRPTDDVKIESGCTGPPLVARYGGKAQPFCDGMGLCCPGRWHPKMRHTSRTAKQRSFCKSLRDLVDDFCRRNLPDMARATFALALGRDGNIPLQERRHGQFA